MSSLSSVVVPTRRGRCIGSVRRGVGPRLICIAALHGNEPAGVDAAQRVLAKLHALDDGLQGELVAVIGNRQALETRRRYVDDDLNRLWTDENLAAIRRGRRVIAEDEELAALDDELERLTDNDGRPVFLLDVHTTSGPSPAFAILDDALANRAFALHLPVPLVLGLEEELAGTLLNRFADSAVTTLGFEAGQHDDPRSVERAEAAIWIAMEASGMLPAGRWPEVAAAGELLAAETAHLPHVVEVRYRHSLQQTTGFQMQPGFRSFQPVCRGELLAREGDQEVFAPQSGRILMPLYQAQGSDGFFVVHRVSPVWLRLSASLRRRRGERFLHWLPGVERHPTLPGAFVVDRTIARWYALEIFHLLGFRRHRDGGRKLIVSRRA